MCYTNISSKIRTKIPELVTIQEGSFILGSNIHLKNETPQQKMSLPVFEIGLYPVTNWQYMFFVQDTTHTPPDYWNATFSPPEELYDYPVVNINVTDVEKYCRWLTKQTGLAFRLPTEFEWEKAARGINDNRIYVWGNNWKENGCNHSSKGISPVFEYYNINKSPFQVVDMLGNVREWTSSKYKPYDSCQYKLEHGVHNVIRGGSYSDPIGVIRTSARLHQDPTKGLENIGFRIAVGSHTGVDSIIFAIQEDENNRMFAGTGFLIQFNEKLYGITCAHVLPNATRKIGQTIYLYHKQGWSFTAKVAWIDPYLTQDDEDQNRRWRTEQDIAILEVNVDDKPVHVIKLAKVKNDQTYYNDRTDCHCFAYIQSADPYGDYIKQIACRYRVADHMIKLSNNQNPKIEKGASGAPLIHGIGQDEQIIGMIRSSSTNNPDAYLIPSSIILNVLKNMLKISS